MQLSAKSVILDLLSASPQAAIPVEALIRGAAVLLQSEGSVRVSLSRLLADELVTSETRGGYRLGKAAYPVQNLVSEWRDCGQTRSSWSGTWLALYGGAPKTRKLQRRHSHAKALLGFKTFRPGLSIRPANLSISEAELHERLFALGLVEHGLLFEMSKLPVKDEKTARTLWNIVELDDSYRKQLALLVDVIGALPELSLEESARRTFFAGRACIRLLTLDPQLPDEIMPSVHRKALVDEMKDFDLIGRKLWQCILDVDVMQVPVWAGVAL